MLPHKSSLLNNKIKAKDRIRMSKQELLTLLETAEEELFKLKSKLDVKIESVEVAQKEIENNKGIYI